MEDEVDGAQLSDDAPVYLRTLFLLPAAAVAVAHTIDTSSYYCLPDAIIAVCVCVQ